jgi:hypothetical protein
MQKTVVVAVSYVVWVPRYKVYEKRVGRHMVRSAILLMNCLHPHTGNHGSLTVMKALSPCAACVPPV